MQRVFGVDTQLIADGTYFVAEVEVNGGPMLAGCGGWSRRKTLYGSDHCSGREDGCSTQPAMRPRYAPFSYIRTGLGRVLAASILEVCEAAAAEAGFRRLEMGATLTGVPLYRARGYAEGAHREVPLAGDLSLSIVVMEKSL